MNVKIGFGAILGIPILIIMGFILYKIFKFSGPFKDSIKKTFTETLNPVSNKNIVYETITSAATTTTPEGKEDSFIDKMFRWFGGQESETKKIADAEYDECLRIWERDGKVSSQQCITVLRNKGFYIP